MPTMLPQATKRNVTPVMTTLVRKTYTSALKRKQRYFLREWKNNASLFTVINGGMLGVAIAIFITSQTVEASILGGATGIVGVTAYASSIVLGVKTNKAIKQEYSHLVEIMTDFYGDQITESILDNAWDLLWSGKQDGVWLNQDNTSVNRISYNEKTDEIVIASKPLAQLQFRRLSILKELDEKKLPSSSGYVQEAIKNLTTGHWEPLRPGEQKLAVSAGVGSAHTDELTINPYNSWAKAMKKNTPTELHPVITEIKSLLIAATTTPVNQEDEHTLQRILRDSTEASNYYQNVVVVTSALPDSDELHAEANGTLNRILHTLKSEAQAITATQAQSAMTKLKIHESYVNPEHYEDRVDTDNPTLEYISPVPLNKS